MELRREAVKNTNTVYVQLVDSKWYRSEFPHELLILDYDENDVLIGLELLGDAANSLVKTIESEVKH